MSLSDSFGESRIRHSGRTLVGRFAKCLGVSQCVHSVDISRARLLVVANPNMSLLDSGAPAGRTGAIGKMLSVCDGPSSSPDASKAICCAPAPAKSRACERALPATSSEDAVRRANKSCSDQPRHVARTSFLCGSCQSLGSAATSRGRITGGASKSNWASPSLNVGESLTCRRLQIPVSLLRNQKRQAKPQATARPIRTCGRIERRGCLLDRQYRCYRGTATICGRKRWRRKHCCRSR